MLDMYMRSQQQHLPHPLPWTGKVADRASQSVDQNLSASARLGRLEVQRELKGE